MTAGIKAIYLVRHAYANWQPTDGPPDESRPLSEQGLLDAQLVANLLAQVSLSRKPITRIISSSYRRAYQTVEPLAERLGLQIQIDDRFRERTLGAWENPSADAVSSFLEAVRRTWQDLDFSFPGGETNRQAQARAVQGLQDGLALPDEAIAIGTHGNILALLLNAYDLQVGADFWQSLSMPDIYRLDFNGADLLAYHRVWTG